MTRSLIFGTRLFLFVALAAAEAALPARAQYDDCGAITANLANKSADRMRADIANLAPNMGCFAAASSTDLAKHNLERFLEMGLKNATQQSTPQGSSATTSAISKPSGNTALIQDVGGFSTTSSGSSFTFQFAPGELMNELGSGGVFRYCTSFIRSQQCVSPRLLPFISAATFSVTANTSTSGSDVKGTAQSGGATAPATLISDLKGATFGSFTAKYAFPFFAQKNSASASPAPDITTQEKAMADAVSHAASLLQGCTAYNSWHDTLNTTALQSQAQARIQQFLEEQYRSLSARIANDATCRPFVATVYPLIDAINALQAAHAAQNEMAASSTPTLGAEYDFVTPTSKPSYHSMKLNFSWQTEVPACAQTNSATAHALSEKGANTDSVKQGGCSQKSSGTTAPSPDYTISASFGADVYQDHPSATIPSASRLRDVQAGAEITRVIHLSAHDYGSTLNALFKRTGDLSLVGAYYYQDQTSPAILNGPPASVTFNGLPTTATQVYAARGPVNLGQVRLGFGTGRSVSFPVALTYSNRSDLVVHPFVGLQFGVSYSLFGN